MTPARPFRAPARTRAARLATSPAHANRRLQLDRSNYLAGVVAGYGPTKSHVSAIIEDGHLTASITVGGQLCKHAGKQTAQPHRNTQPHNHTTTQPHKNTTTHN